MEVVFSLYASALPGASGHPLRGAFLPVRGVRRLLQDAFGAEEPRADHPPAAPSLHLHQLRQEVQHKVCSESPHEAARQQVSPPATGVAPPKGVILK